MLLCSRVWLNHATQLRVASSRSSTPRRAPHGIQHRCVTYGIYVGKDLAGSFVRQLGARLTTVGGDTPADQESLGPWRRSDSNTASTNTYSTPDIG
jgi:hypothetical protein